MITPATHVRVLVECVLNGPDHRSLGQLSVGDECIIAGDWYAQACIDSGLVERLSSDDEAHKIRAKVENEISNTTTDEDDSVFKKPSEVSVGQSGGSLPGRVSDLADPSDGIAKSRGRRPNQK